MPRQIRILVGEPQRIFMEGLLRDLAEEDDIEVVATATTTRAVIAAIKKHDELDVVLTALLMPDASGLRILESGLPVLFLSAERSPDKIMQAILQGARGYLLKWDSQVVVADAIRRVANGNIVLCGQGLNTFIEAIRQMVTERAISNHKTLTTRELEVLTGFSRGRSQPEIGEHLHISTSTVKNTAHNIYSKLGVMNRPEAIKIAMEQGLI